MAKPTRTFSADVGQASVGTAGPDQIEYDLDNIFAMFDPSKTLRDGSQGGIRRENIADAGQSNGLATLDANSRVAQDVAYTSSVSGFTPASVKAALDALAGVRIVERGSNANGEYVRWENGVQVCYRRWEQEPNTGSGTYVVRDNRVIWTFPAAFLYIPAIFVAGEPDFWAQPWQDATYPANDFGGIGIDPLSTATTYPTSTTSVRFKYFYRCWNGRVAINALAIGVWK